MLTAVSVAAAASGVGSAADTGERLSDGFYEAHVLEPAAAYVARRSVTIRCASSDAAWKGFVVAHEGENTGEHGLADIPNGRAYLEPAVCSSLRAALQGREQYLPTLAATIEVLTHESIHLRGEHDEGETDCAAMHSMPGVAVRYFHVRAGKQLRALMAAAWTFHRAAGPQYLTVC